MDAVEKGLTKGAGDIAEESYRLLNSEEPEEDTEDSTEV